MAYLQGGANGVLNDTTEVEIVPAPAAGHRRQVGVVRICNLDTDPIELTYSYLDGAIYSSIILTLDPGDTMIDDDKVILDDTTKSIVAVLGGAVSANQPSFVASWMDDDT